MRPVPFMSSSPNAAFGGRKRNMPAAGRLYASALIVPDARGSGGGREG